mmetsp:Transcript_26983/g.85560  ORF Transcript_26983/g.85560 Transcript_26983/m.85560 type:complete len:307 (+) Transcript_26983:1816-2736(+)
MRITPQRRALAATHCHTVARTQVDSRAATGARPPQAPVSPTHPVLSPSTPFTLPPRRWPPPRRRPLRTRFAPPSPRTPHQAHPRRRPSPPPQYRRTPPRRVFFWCLRTARAAPPARAVSRQTTRRKRREGKGGRKTGGGVKATGGTTRDFKAWGAQARGMKTPDAAAGGSTLRFTFPPQPPPPYTRRPPPRLPRPARHARTCLLHARRDLCVAVPAPVVWLPTVKPASTAWTSRGTVGLGSRSRRASGAAASSSRPGGRVDEEIRARSRPGGRAQEEIRARSRPGGRGYAKAPTPHRNESATGWLG